MLHTIADLYWVDTSIGFGPHESPTSRPVLPNRKIAFSPRYPNSLPDAILN